MSRLHCTWLIASMISHRLLWTMVACSGRKWPPLFRCLLGPNVNTDTLECLFSWLVPVPKKLTLSEVIDYQPDALTSHLMKVLERPCWPIWLTGEKIDRPSTVHLSAWSGSGWCNYLCAAESMRITFFDFSSAFKKWLCGVVWEKSSPSISIKLVK